jgi:hypothetical protein
MSSSSLFPFNLPMKVLKIAGVWQRKSSSWTYFCYGIVVHLIFVDLYTLLQFAYLFTFETFEDFAILMSLLPTYCSLTVKSIIFMTRGDKVAELLNTLKEMVEREKFSENLEKHLKRIDFVFKFFWGSAAVTCFMALGIPFINQELPFLMWFPYDYKNNEFLFWFNVAYQGSEVLCYSAVNVILDTIPAMFLCYIHGMLEEFYGRLESIQAEESSMERTRDVKNRQKNFLDCMALHSKIVGMAKKVEEYFSTMIMVQGLMSSVILCTTAYALTIVSFEVSDDYPSGVQ